MASTSLVVLPQSMFTPKFPVELVRYELYCVIQLVVRQDGHTITLGSQMGWIERGVDV